MKTVMIARAMAAAFSLVLSSGAAAQITTSSRGVVSPAPPPAPPPARPPPAASAGEIAEALRGEINAIAGTGAGRRVLVSRSEPWGRVTRTLRLGDVYREGWRISAIGAAQVTLSKDGARQTVDIGGRVAGAGSAIAAPERPVVVAASLGLISPTPPPAEVAAEAATGAAIDIDLVNALIDQLAILAAAASARQ